MIYILFLIMFLAITLKYIVYSILLFIWNFTIPITEMKREYLELFNSINEYRNEQ